jgi:hypothetical protein
MPLLGGQKLDSVKVKRGKAIEVKNRLQRPASQGGKSKRSWKRRIRRETGSWEAAHVHNYFFFRLPQSNASLVNSGVGPDGDTEGDANGGCG